MNFQRLGNRPTSNFVDGRNFCSESFEWGYPVDRHQGIRSSTRYSNVLSDGAISAYYDLQIAIKNRGARIRQRACTKCVLWMDSTASETKVAKQI